MSYEEEELETSAGFRVSDDEDANDDDLLDEPLDLDFGLDEEDPDSDH